MLLTDSHRGLIARAPFLGPRLLFRLQGIGAGFRETNWPDAVQQILSGASVESSIVSVDVFDTCVVRRLASDEPIEFVITQLDSDESIAGEVAEEMERELCCPVPGVAGHLNVLRAAGARIVFLSDTDRSSESLVEILRSYGIFVEGDQLVASCEAGATKSDGDLFSQMWPGKQNPAVWHIGNNRWSDITMAAAAGLKPLLISNADLNRYEAAMSVRSDGFGPALAGAARLARLSVEEEHSIGSIGSHSAELRSFGACVSGQVMSAFVLWVAEQSRISGVEHLAFLARDGELPFEIASAIPTDHWEGRTLSYLHCSRLTWSLAAAAVLGVEAWLASGVRDANSFLLSKQHEIPFKALVARIGLDVQGVRDITGYEELHKLDPDDVLPPSAAAEWKGLLRDSRSHRIIAAQAEERLDLIVDSLQSSDLPRGKVGLVDVGWSGQLASHVSAVLKEVVGDNTVHFHFGGENILDDLTGVTIKRFAFDGRSSPLPIANPVSCVETLTASGKPRVIGYRRRGSGEVEMIFDKGTNINSRDRDDMWLGAIQMARLVPNRKTLNEWKLNSSTLAAEAKAILDLWWNHPTVDEAIALSELTFEHDEAGTVLRPLVRPYTWSEFQQRRQVTRRNWTQGSAVVSGPLLRLSLSGFWALRRRRAQKTD